MARPAVSRSVEVVHSQTGGRQFRRQIGSVVLATFFESTGVQQVRYLHRDHLGSTTAITTETGQVAVWMSFDPWG
ncbi:MAG: hypothetical protein MEQ07_09710 [Aquimonas sp.]|nr:hypothetical protein [Aquimonas sp.]